ncbi:carboxymuconolactone decarboxylase family protein [Myxococcota bacterium]|nr:carboxymuconolactone decarboxylase family protein [Myxococcota bacterium]
MSAVDHPWIKKKFFETETLNARERIWTFLAGATAKGDLKGVAEHWIHLDSKDQHGGIEAILQTLLFAGYPRAINALAQVRRIGVEPELFTEPQDTLRADWQRNGEELCRAVYGTSYDTLRENITWLHPDLDLWVVETGYGRVLSRPGLSARQRELCVVAVLAGQDVAPQLRSHLQGAINVGATMGECRSVLDQTQAVWGDDAQSQADMVWAHFAQKTYS